MHELRPPQIEFQHMQQSAIEAAASIVVQNTASIEQVATALEQLKQPEQPAQVFLVGEAIEQRERYVKIAPRFADQVADETRINTFRYAKMRHPMGSCNIAPEMESRVADELTEHDGLVELHRFLKKIAGLRSPQLKNVLTIQCAQGMLENLTFIGKKEYDEAAKGLATMWKDYLDADPRNQLCVPLAISEKHDVIKSDTHVFENIILTFADEELEDYKGRIVTHAEDIAEDPTHTKVVLLDDWSVSGAQLRQAYADLVQDRRFARVKDRFEVNLLVANEDRLYAGLDVTPWTNLRTRLPVFSYYKAHNAPRTSTQSRHGAHVTGVHSSVDYDFENEIGAMRNLLQQKTRLRKPFAPAPTMPPLTNIIRAYRFAAPRVVVGLDGAIIKHV